MSKEEKMRTLTGHKVNRCNEELQIEVLDAPGSGGASHCYQISGYKSATNPEAELPFEIGVPEGYDVTTILFQNGPILEAGVNGITHETLLAILEDRLAGFQAGKWACEQNAQALHHIREAMRVLKSRTENRLDRGVEGTHTV